MEAQTVITSNDIAAAGAALDSALVDWRCRDRWSDAWSGPAQRWAELVWEKAAELGPLTLAPADIAAGQRVAQAPVYVCGAPRSGTTLVRDLLDGHPALAVLPSEGKFFKAFEALRDASAIDDHARHWLALLANPNHQQPFWLLGPGSSADSRYVRFARALLSWNAVLAGDELPWRVQPAIALALATAKGQEISGIRRSVDKSPGYEFYAQQIWPRQPVAKMIYVARDPRAVVASFLEGRSRNRLELVPAAQVLKRLVRSLHAGWRAARRMPAEGFLVVCYEDLVADRRREMARVAEFLEIGWNDSLLEQTIAGAAAEPNSSFHGFARASFSARSTSESIWLRLAEGFYGTMVRNRR